MAGRKRAGGNVFRIKVTRGTARRGTLDSRITETEQITEQKTGPKYKLISEGMRCRAGLMREMHCRCGGRADWGGAQETGPGWLNRYETGAEGKSGWWGAWENRMGKQNSGKRAQDIIEPWKTHTRWNQNDRTKTDKRGVRGNVGGLPKVNTINPEGELNVFTWESLRYFLKRGVQNHKCWPCDGTRGKVRGS